MCDRDPPALPLAMCAFMAVFDKYAKEDGDRTTLTKEEFKKLAENELPQVVEKAKAKGCSFEKLDLNSDGVLDFPEFMAALAKVACTCHEKSFGKHQCKK